MSMGPLQVSERFYKLLGTPSTTVVNFPEQNMNRIISNGNWCIEHSTIFYKCGTIHNLLYIFLTYYGQVYVFKYSIHYQSHIIYMWKGQGHLI